MLRWLALLLLVTGAGIVLHRRRQSLRRRLRLALWFALAAYSLLFALRLAFRPPEEAHIQTLGWVLGGMGAVWLALWLIAGRRARRRD